MWFNEIANVRARWAARAIVFIASRGTPSQARTNSSSARFSVNPFSIMAGPEKAPCLRMWLVTSSRRSNTRAISKSGEVLGIYVAARASARSVAFCPPVMRSNSPRTRRLPFPVPQTQSAFHRRARRNAFRRAARQRSRLCALHESGMSRIKSRRCALLGRCNISDLIQ